MIVGPAFKSQSAIRGVSVGHVATQCICMYVCVCVCVCLQMWFENSKANIDG
jgi:hypothetical protein